MQKVWWKNEYFIFVILKHQISRKDKISLQLAFKTFLDTAY